MTDIDIELVYFSGCPNVDDARESLRSALTELGRETDWTEWNLDEADSPARVRGYASPAVLVRGEHVLGEKPVRSHATACSALGAPPASAIVEAVRGVR